MRILIEENQYDAAAIRDVLHGIDALENVEGKVAVQYVGYYYNAALKDCVFILPKVLLKDVKGKDLVFGHHRPESIVNISDEKNPLSDTEKAFIYKFAVWVYRAVVVFKNSHPHSDIVYHVQVVQTGRGRRRKTNTYLDILLSLIQFAKDNKSYFFFILKNLHSGFNKINWTKTISKTAAIVQGGSPIYLNPINRKRQINFDEELLIIFFSILNYIGETYGFEVEINLNFNLIRGSAFKRYLSGYGLRRLRQIKYKYFSDKAIELWNLCYAFFAESDRMVVNAAHKEYLLVKNFYVVFEAIIDELIGDNPLPDGMTKEQDDGKILDHLYTYQGLIDNEQTYYIGDSKYYKIGHDIGKYSIHKQFTYARNVIQANLDIFLDGKEPESGVALRDDETEGYRIVPNFFISARMADDFNYADDGITKTGRAKGRHTNRHFANRLYDRDTLLLYHYDVNFLYVLSLYARNNATAKGAWKTKVRKMFRDEIRNWLREDYKFYAMQAHPDVSSRAYIGEHFQDVLGKVYKPYEDNAIYSLALDTNNKYKPENEALIKQLKESFYVVECELGRDPRELLDREMEAQAEMVGIKAARKHSRDRALVVWVGDGLTILRTRVKESFGLLLNSQTEAMGLIMEAGKADWLLLVGVDDCALYDNRGCHVVEYDKFSLHSKKVEPGNGVIDCHGIPSVVFKKGGFVETCKNMIILDIGGEAPKYLSEAMAISNVPSLENDLLATIMPMSMLIKG